jgi:hypothetical protein
LEGDVVELMQTPQVCLKYLAPGRLVRAVEDLAGTAKTAGDVLESKRYEDRSREIAGRLKWRSSGVGVNGNGDQGTVDWGWGVVLGWERVSKMKEGKREENEREEGEEGEVVGVAEVEEAHLLDVSSPDAFVVYVLLPTKNKPGLHSAYLLSWCKSTDTDAAFAASERSSWWGGKRCWRCWYGWRETEGY